MAKSLWDEFKDLFKTKSQREQEKQESVDEALEREKDVVKQLEELDKQYKDSLPEEEAPDLDRLFPKDSGYEEMEYSAPTDEELEREAKDSVESKKAIDREKLENKYSVAADEVEADKKAAKSALEEDLDALDTKYAREGESAKNSALERGVSRGSILSSALSELAESKKQAAGSLKSGYEGRLAELDDQLASLQKQLDGAIEELDMKYAVQLNEEIAKLKSERDKEVQKYEKYNSEIRQKQAQYASEREQDIEEYLADLEVKKQQEKLAELERENRYGYEGEKQKNYAERYEIAYDFYMSLDPDIALAALEASPNMKYYLGAYYDKLQKQLASRNSSVKRYF